MPPMLPVDIRGRRWSLQYEAGDVFKDGTPYEGVTLKIEIRSLEEANAVAEQILRITSNDPQEKSESS